MRQDFLLLLPLLTPDYVVEAHFCLHRQTGESLWENLFYEEREKIKAYGVHDNLIAAQRIDPWGETSGLWRIDLREGEPIIPTYPDTFWGRRKQRNAQKHWWYMGDGYGLRGPINADGTVPTSSGLLDLKSLTLLHENTFDIPEPEFTPLSLLINTHRLDVPSLGILRHRVATEPEEKVYGPEYHLDYPTVEQFIWLENIEGERLWEFDLAEETKTVPPCSVELRLHSPHALILLFWPTDRWKEPEIYDPGSYQIWVLDLRTGEVIQRLKPVEEGFGGYISFDDAGLLFHANVRISGQHGCEFVYYPFSEPGEDAALGASDDR